MEILMQRILVIQTAFLGDAILTLPMIQQIKKTSPSAIIDVIAIPSTKEIFSSSPGVNEVTVFEKRGKHKSILSTIKFAFAVKEKKYDKIISPHRSFRTSLIVFLSGVKDTAGFDKASFSRVYKTKIKYLISDHEVERNLKLIGYDTANEAWKIFPEIKGSRQAEEKVENYLKENKPGKFAVLAPGAVWSTKRYPEKYFKTIAAYLIDKKYSVILIGGKDDFALCEFITEGLGKSAFNTAGFFSLTESILLIQKSVLLISNDSAPTHMGMAAKVPVITIYCSTIPDFGFYPYSPKSRIISYNDLQCKPCGIHGHRVCPLKTFDCGLKLDPKSVIKDINYLLE